MKTFQRISAVDFLQGLVMIIMLLDQVREFVHADAFRFNPTDLSNRLGTALIVLFAAASAVMM